MSIDYLFTSKLSIPSTNQPGYRGCIYMSILKWVYDKRALKKINQAYSEIGFVELHKMADVHTRMLFSLYSHNFISADICYNMFKEIFDQRIEEFSDKIIFDKDFIAEDKFSSLAKWLLVSIVKYITRPNEFILAKLRRDIQSLTPMDVGILGNPRVDTLVVTAFLELMYPVKYAIFSTNKNLQELGLSDLLLFKDYLKE